MVLKHYYRNDAGTLVEQTLVPREGWELKESAEEGATAMTTIVVPDPDLTLDYKGHRRWIVKEDSSEADDDVLFSGFVADQEIGRTGGDMVELQGRVWSLSLVDMNSLWGRRVMIGSDCNRGAETDVARMQWLLASSEMGFFDDITTYVSTAGPVNMDAVDYRGQFSQQVADDCSQASGKNWWIGCLDPDGLGVTDNFAWYGADSVATYASTLSMSNDPADWDDADLLDGTSLVWPISWDTKLRRDPSRIFSGVYLPYEGGAIYRQDASTRAEFVLSGRDMIAPSLNVKSSAKAIARAVRYLADLDEQDERITTSVELPKGKATMLRAGMRVEFKATHLPGYETARACRVLSCAVSPVAGGSKYRLALELTPVGPASGGTATFAVMFSRDDGVVDVPPTGTSAVVDYEPTGTSGFIGMAYGLTALSGSLSWDHPGIGTNWSELVVARFGNVGTPAAPVTAFDSDFSVDATISVTTTGAGIILGAIRIYNFDSGARTLADPTDWVTIHERMNAGGATDRDWGAVNVGYRPVSAAGTYDLTWTMSNQFNWVKVMAAIFIPSSGTVTLDDSAASVMSQEDIVTATL